MCTKGKSRCRNRGFKWISDIAVVVAASLIYSLGLHCFTAPNNIAPGGVIGVATVVNAFTRIPVGVLYGLFNLPLVIIGYIVLGKTRMIKTVVSVVTITVATDFLFRKLPFYAGDKILAAVFGGLLFGAGMGLIYLKEGTTGGIDIVNKIISGKKPHLKIGAIMLVSDAVIIAAAMLAFRSVESGLYALIAIFVSGRVVDLIVYGGLEGKLMLIFSDKRVEIARILLQDIRRGVTFLKGTGAYSGEDREVICCVVHKNQYAKVKRKIGEIDKNAFIVIANAGEVFGEGFNLMRE